MILKKVWLGMEARSEEGHVLLRKQSSSARSNQRTSHLQAFLTMQSKNP